jgi:hypothetical protein
MHSREGGNPLYNKAFRVFLRCDFLGSPISRGRQKRVSHGFSGGQQERVVEIRILYKNVLEIKLYLNIRHSVIIKIINYFYDLFMAICKIYFCSIT